LFGLVPQTDLPQHLLEIREDSAGLNRGEQLRCLLPLPFIDPPLDLVLQVFDLAPQQKCVVFSQRLGWPRERLWLWCDQPSQHEERQHNGQCLPSLEYGRKIGKGDVDPSLDAVHGAVPYKASLHAIGVERIPPGWLDGPFPQSIDPTPCRFQPSSQSSFKSETKVVSEVDRHAHGPTYSSTLVLPRSRQLRRENPTTFKCHLAAFHLANKVAT